MSAALDTHGINLPSRYEIRKILPEHEEWCRALLIQSLLLKSPVWRPVVPEPKVKTALKAYEVLEPYDGHSLRNGLSWALFDREYQYKRPESIDSGGALYWHEIDSEDPQLEEKGEQWMVEKMDFPIVGLALSHDVLNPQPQEAVMAKASLLPLWAAVMSHHGKTVRTLPGMPAPTALGQYIHRSGCVTRSGYESQGLGKLFSWWVMLEMKERGFQGLLVGAGNQAISKVWLSDDAPFKSGALIEVELADLELDIEGQKILPYANHGFKFKYIFCDLNKPNMVETEVEGNQSR